VSSTKTTRSQKKSNRKDRSMYDSLQKTGLKTASNAIRTEFERKSNECRTMIEQNALVFSLKSDLRRSLRGGVYLFAASGYPHCRYCHMTTWVGNATVLAFCAGREKSGSYETPGAN